MSKVSINKLLFLFFTISSLISCSKNIRSLETVKVNEISTQVATDIKSAEYYFSETGEAYFSYDISKLSAGNYILLSIHNSGSKKLVIKCLLSTDTAMESDFGSKDSICKQVYESSEYKVYNILFSFQESEIKSGSKLFLKINSNKSNLYLFVRESNAYKEEITSQDISNSFAYTAFKFDAKNYYNQQYLLTASQNQGFLIYGHSGDKYWEIDETSALPITNQTLAANFWDLDKKIIFAGKFGYNSSMTDTTLNIKLTEIKDDNIKIYYYTRINYDNYYGFNSFHYECTDKNTQHYLIVNYRTLENYDYFYTFNNLIGTSPYLADFPPSVSDITKLEYSEVKKTNYLTKKDYSIQVFKFQCSGEGSKIVSNLKYSRINIKDKFTPGNSAINDYLYKFEKDKKFTLTYSATKYQFVIEIFTPSTQESKNFNVEFENKQLVLNNNKKYIFTRTNTEYKNMTFKTDETIDAVISFTPSIKDSSSSSKQDYLTLKNYIIDDKIYYYYELDHEYDANYFVNITVNNPTNNVVPFCYYLSTLPVMQNVGQNCILLPAKTTQNLTFKNIFTYSGKDDFNVEEPKYSIIMYNNRSEDEYDITYVDFKTDLPKSTPINTYYQGFTLYLESKLEKNKDSFFNVDLNNSTDEYHLDLYILNDVSNYQESKLDIKCISAYEVAIKFIEPLFTEENNICYHINKDDYKSNVSHVIIKGIKKDSNNRLLIKLSPKEDMNIRFLFNTNEIVNKNYDFNKEFGENIYIFSYPSVYKIFEVNKTNLEEFKSKYLVFYDKDKNGGIEIYTRNQYQFKRIYKDDYFTFINIDEFLSKYQSYDKFLFVLGKNDCKDIMCSVNSLKYQVKKLENVQFKSINEFNGYYRFPINVNKCTKEYYHMIFSYGKEIKYEQFSLGKYVISGTLESGNYIDTFLNDDFENTKFLLKSYQILNDNMHHLNIIKFKCTKNFNAFLDYFIKFDPKTLIQLNEGEVKYFIMTNNSNFTFNYKSIDKFKVDIIEGDDPIIYFEHELKKIKSSVIYFSRKNNNTNLFYISGPKEKDTIIRITTLINLENLPKTNLDNLYKKNGIFIYDIPKGALNVTFIITRKSYRLRLLDENQDGIQVCYTLADTIILTKDSSNCFNLKDKYVLEHDVPDDDGKYYMTLYSEEDNQEFNVEKVSSFVKKDEGNSNGGQGNKNEEEDDEGGVSWVVILLIILLVLILIGVAVFVIIKIRKKRLSSKEIEKDVNEPSPITDQEMTE